MTPEIFAPEIFSKTQPEWAFDSVFSPCGTEFYFTKYFAEEDVSKIMCMKRVNDEWTKPEAVSFNGFYNNNNLCISPDGFRIFFKSWRPLPNNNTPEETSYIWYVHRTKGGWSEAQPVEYINEYLPAGHPAVSNTGTLYFRYRGKDNKGNADTHKSRFVNGTYSTPENLSHTLNTKYIEGDVCVAPDESYIIYLRRGDKGFGGVDLFISFKNEDGSWTEGKNMGSDINSSATEYCPTVSPDGRYFFFTSNRRMYTPYSETPLSYKKKLEILGSPGNGFGDIYWVDARVIEELKPDELK
jgi:hypothetical protein